MAKRVKLCITNDPIRMKRQLRIEYPTISNIATLNCSSKEKAQEEQIRKARVFKCDWHSNIIESNNPKAKWVLLRFTY